MSLRRIIMAFSCLQLKLALRAQVPHQKADRKAPLNIVKGVARAHKAPQKARLKMRSKGFKIRGV